MTTRPSHARALAETLYVTDTADDLRLWIAAIEAHDGETRAAAIGECANTVDSLYHTQYPQPTDWDYGAQDGLFVAAKTIRALLSQPPAPDPRDALLKRAARALEWYADKLNYAVTQVKEPRSPVHWDDGRKAREALAAIGRVVR
jgi:hypothetical protein